MFDLRIQYRKKGLSDVFVRYSCPPVRAGVICSLTTMNPRKKEWVFLPAKWFSRRFPVFKPNCFLIGNSRASALDRYLQEVSCDA